MESRAEGLIETLREARRLKGWSQRDLSEKAGLTQAHLSRIESGAIDLKLSTMLELARLLDLEPLLVPRTALSAVNAVVREADAHRDARSVRGAANSLEQLARMLRLERPDDPTGQHLAEVARELLLPEPIVRAPTEIAELLTITDQIMAAVRRPDPRRANVRKAVDRLARLRSRLAHQQPETQRPAYSLDDED